MSAPQKSWPGPKTRRASKERQRCASLEWLRCNGDGCGLAFYGSIVLDEPPTDPEAPTGICLPCQGDRR